MKKQPNLPDCFAIFAAGLRLMLTLAWVSFIGSSLHADSRTGGTSSGMGGAGAIRLTGAAGARMIDGLVVVKFRLPLTGFAKGGRTGSPSLDRLLSVQNVVAIEPSFLPPGR